MDRIEEKLVGFTDSLNFDDIGMERCRAFLDWAWRLEDADPIGEIFPLVTIP